MMFKRALDVAVSAVGLALLSPVLLIVALLIRVNMGSPIFFRQTRPGLNGVPFDIIKFRTMRSGAAGADDVASDAGRLTSLGRLLRRTSVDELPELWNVLRGDMSLVGPRPLLMQYLDRYSPEQSRRHNMRPGLTGLAQINGRNALSWEEKFELDIFYVDHWSLLLDLKILALTFLHLVRPSGIAAEGVATMPEFMGTAPADPGRKSKLPPEVEKD